MALQIPVLSITEESPGVFFLSGPNGQSEVISADALNEKLANLMANYSIALDIATALWWSGRAAAAEDKAAYDASHCRLITWNPLAEQAVSYDSLP